MHRIRMPPQIPNVGFPKLQPYLHPHLFSIFVYSRNTVNAGHERLFSCPIGVGAPKARKIRCNDERNKLKVEFEDGSCYSYLAEYLRVYSPSAETGGKGSVRKLYPGGRMHVRILDVVPVGNYAIRIEFDDMHTTGIYSWTYLEELALNKFTLMKRYIRGLTRSGKRRNVLRKY